MCARLRSSVADGGASRLRTSRSRSQTAVRHRPKRPSFDFCGWERASLARDATWSFVVRTDDSSLAWICWTTAQAVSYTHLRAHETVLDLVCRLLLEKKK